MERAVEVLDWRGERLLEVRDPRVRRQPVEPSVALERHLDSTVCGHGITDVGGEEDRIEVGCDRAQLLLVGGSGNKTETHAVIGQSLCDRMADPLACSRDDRDGVRHRLARASRVRSRPLGTRSRFRHGHACRDTNTSMQTGCPRCGDRHPAEGSASSGSTRRLGSPHANDRITAPVGLEVTLGRDPSRRSPVRGQLQRVRRDRPARRRRGRLWHRRVARSG